MLARLSPSWFGMHRNKPAAEWPSIPFGSLRLWDCGVSWAECNPWYNEYQWSALDAVVNAARSQQVEVLYTLGRTPRWAARNPNESCTYSAGSCSPPARWEDWERFVDQLTKRYRGKIHAYELWNEPDTYPGHAKFWAGTDEELYTLCDKAIAVIRTHDPGAWVLSPGFVSSTAAVRFIETGHAQEVDAIGIHGYLFSNYERNLLSRIANIRTALETAGLPDKEVWLTEWSWGKETTVLCRTEQARYLARTVCLFAGLRVDRAIWYGWDFSPWGTLSTPSGERFAAHVWRSLYQRLVGAENLSLALSPQGDVLIAYTRQQQPCSIRWNVKDDTFPFFS